MKYEWDLYRFTQKYYPVLNRADFGGQKLPLRNPDKIHNSFTMLHSAYLKEEQAYEYDLVFTLYACINTILMITANTVAMREFSSSGLVIGAAKG